MNTSQRSRAGNALALLLLAALAAWLLRLHAAPWPAATPLPSPRWLAAAACALWLLLCLWAWRRGRGVPAPPQDAAADWLVIHASQTGTALELAQRSAYSLREAGRTVALHDLATLDAAQLHGKHCLFVASTTGEGDPPDAALGFAAQAMAQPAALQGTQYAVLALGDRSYAGYCAFGHRLDAWLRASGAQPLFDLVEVDNADPAALRHWQQQLGVLRGRSEEQDWSQPQYQRWTLAARRLLNPGSAGGPTYHLELVPPSGEDVTWQAGDIVEVGPRDAQGELLPHREYSIASTPTNGRLELLVRLMQREDGSLGHGSGWLCQHAAVGATIDLRIRANPNFHAPDPARPLILIGNGTGLAGLRAHLQARIEAGAQRNWLLFGERNAAHDAYFGDELEDWLHAGQLARLDRVYSRDGGALRYVQDALQQYASRLQQWLDEGAALYVCGSLQGMAPGVDAVLLELLGASGVTELQRQGRYRRDVY